MKRIIYQLAGFTVLITCIMSCQHTHETVRQEEAIPVIAEQVQQSSFSNAINISGNVKGQETVRLGFMVAGKIAYVAKEEGEKIKKGELLASLDPQRYQLGRNMAKAKYDEVQDEYTRLSKMYEKGSIPESDFVKISSGLEQARSQYELQQKDLQDTRLYAPVSGILIKRGMEPGEITGQGTPAFVISDIDTVQINAAVPEGEVPHLSIGDSAYVDIPAIDSTFRGSIQLIAPAAEPSTRTFNIKINIANPELLLKPGMIAEVSIPTAGAVKQISVSPSAIMKDVDNTSYVFVADPQKNKAYKRKVSTGSVTGNQIAISSGLNTGEWVVTGGKANLHDGSTITLKQ